jgi:hypothetical protein
LAWTTSLDTQPGREATALIDAGPVTFSGALYSVE